MVYRDDQEAEWVASCLDLGLVAAGPRKLDAMKGLKEVIQTQLQFTAENDNWAHLFHPASAEEWERYEQLRNAHRRQACQHEKLNTSGLKRPVDLCFA